MSLALASRRAAISPAWVKNPLWRTARAVPSLDQPFADTKSLVDAVTGQSLVTFTRASSGTSVGSDGVLRTATTNLLLRSEEFDNASWTKITATVTSNVATAPSGTVTADKLIVDNGQSAGYASQTISFVSGTSYTASCYAKAGEVSDFRFVFESGAFGSNLNAIFNLNTGVVSSFTAASASIQTVGNGWYRCVATALATATASAGVQFRSVHAGNGTNGILLWGAQLEQSSTVGEYIPTTSTINSAPRFDHDPTTGESLGLLVEEQRTNSITNNTMQGAVAGTPGTNPTNWFITAAANGISPEIVRTGVEDGVTYVDIRYSGTSTGAGSFSILASAITAITAATGQSWTGSAYVKLQAGSLSNLTNTLHSVNGRSAIGAGLESTNVIYTPTSDRLGVQRRAVSITLVNNSTARISHTIFNATYASGVAIDITLRIGMPQLEQGAFATSVIPTTTAAATRSADVASITGTAFSSWYSQSEGTVFAEASAAGVSQTVLGFSDGTSSNRILLETGTNTKRLTVSAGGSAQASVTRPYAYGLITKTAIAVTTDNFVLADSGVLGAEDTSGSMPTTNRLNVGANATGGVPLNGTIRRLTYWPARLPNSTLQALTQ